MSWLRMKSTILERRSVLGNGVMIAGDCTVGQCSIMSSNSMLHERSEIGDWVLIKGGCRIVGNVPPYVVIAHNPAVYYGINAVIMRKHGFTEDQIDDVAKCYRHVYQSGTSVFNAVRRIEADVDPSDIRSCGAYATVYDHILAYYVVVTYRAVAFIAFPAEILRVGSYNGALIDFVVASHARAAYYARVGQYLAVIAYLYIGVNERERVNCDVVAYLCRWVNM